MNDIILDGKVFKYNELKGKFYCHEKVDADYFCKKHKLYMIDAPVECIETHELEEWFTEKMNKRLDSMTKRALKRLELENSN